MDSRQSVYPQDDDEEENLENQKNQTRIYYDENGKKVIKLREMTQLERQYFDDARKRHRTNMIRPQVIKGKEFKGKSFICKPETIEFKDFEVGQPYQQTIYLTNASYKKCGFSLMPLKENIRDFFEIIYKHPGQMPPGMSVALTIRFHPQLNQDIDDVFPILSETGQIDFPLVCTCKKAIVKIPNNVVDFKTVIYGEKGTQYLKLVNEGALPTELSIKSSKGFDINTKTETYSVASSQMIGNTNKSELSNSQIQQDSEQENLSKNLSQLKFQKTYVIQGYSTLNIPITYEPTEIKAFELPLVVYFENYIHSPPIEVVFRGECIEVPIYVEKPLYDFEICLYNHIYREKIIFHNRSQNAMKIQIVAPKETKNFFEFNPMLGYIQGNSSFEVWVKMSVEKDLLTLCHKYVTKENVFEIPFKLIGADQVVPVPFIIKAQLTIDTVQIIPGKINFGRLYEGTAARMSLTCENLSDLPQELVFYPLPKEISVTPDLIPLKLLPKEKFQTTLVYRSGEAVQDNKKDESYLRCKIITGTISTRDIRIPYQCDIIKCPLEFSAMKIDLPVMQIDEIYNTHVMVKNITYKDMLFEVFLPEFEICGLKIQPMVEKIQAGKQQEINIEYKSFFKRLGAFTLDEIKSKYESDPTKNFDLSLKVQEEKEKKEQEEEEQPKKDDKKAAKKDTKKDAKKEKLNKQQQAELEAELKRQEELELERQQLEAQQKLEIERNFDMEGELAKLGGKLKEFHEDTDRHSQHYTWLIPFYFKFVDSPHTNKYVTYLEINTTSVQKSLVLDQIVIDFGEIAVGIRETKDILVTNFGQDTANITMDLLPQYCGFSVINALRPSEAEVEREKNQLKKKKLVVQFEPLEEQPYLETMKIKCRTTCVSAKLIGKGVRPQVQVTPEDGLINIGGVVLGESCEKTFTIQNISNFAVKFKIAEKASGINNKSGTSVFSFIPSEAQIEANQSMEIKVIFTPDRISEKFFTLIGVDIPFQKDEKRIFLWGSCYSRSGYVMYYQPYLALPQAESLRGKIERQYDPLKIKDEETIFSPLNNKIVLEFQKIKFKSNQSADKNSLQFKGGENEQGEVEEQEEEDEKCFTRKIVIGNTKIFSDPKLEKPINFEISLPKDDKFNYFSCDNLKAAVNAGQEIVVTFTFKPPQNDETISHIEALQGLGQWKELKSELKISGGYLTPNIQDPWNFDIILRAYINQI